MALAGISSMATRAVLGELAHAYGERTGTSVEVVATGGVDAARRVEAGEAFDFVVLARDALERLATLRRVEAGSIADVARSSIAVAVASGALAPDITSEDGVRDAVLGARSVGYSTGPSGTHLADLFARWGIAETIAPRLVQAPPGVAVASLIARGDVDLGFQQLSELLHVPGVHVVGLLPREIRKDTVFAAGVCTASTRAVAARALLAFLASDEVAAAKRRHGMEPVAHVPGG